MGKTLEAPLHTVADHIPLGRRIEELKKEKGAWYSTNAMSERIGISVPTLRDMLKSRRVIYSFELTKIAQDLKVPVDRILQEDLKGEIEALESLLQSRKNPDIYPYYRLPQRYLFLSHMHYRTPKTVLPKSSVLCLSQNRTLRQLYTHFYTQKTPPEPSPNALSTHLVEIAGFRNNCISKPTYPLVSSPIISPSNFISM